MRCWIEHCQTPTPDDHEELCFVIPVDELEEYGDTTLFAIGGELLLRTDRGRKIAAVIFAHNEKAAHGTFNLDELDEATIERYVREYG